jgi:hypothetical protein
MAARATDGAAISTRVALLFGAGPRRDPQFLRPVVEHCVADAFVRATGWAPRQSLEELIAVSLRAWG